MYMQEESVKIFKHWWDSEIENTCTEIIMAAWNNYGLPVMHAQNFIKM